MYAGQTLAKLCVNWEHRTDNICDSSHVTVMWLSNRYLIVKYSGSWSICFIQLFLVSLQSSRTRKFKITIVVCFPALQGSFENSSWTVQELFKIVSRIIKEVLRFLQGFKFWRISGRGNRQPNHVFSDWHQNIVWIQHLYHGESLLTGCYFVESWVNGWPRSRLSWSTSRRSNSRPILVNILQVSPLSNKEQPWLAG